MTCPGRQEMVGNRSPDVVWMVPLSALTAYTAYSQSRWREAKRCAGSHFSKNSVIPTCIASMRRSCWFSRARPSLVMLNMSELAFSEANSTSRRHLDICSNFISHPLIMTSMSFDVIGVGGVGLSTLGSSSLKCTSSSSISWEDSTSLIFY